MKKQYETPTVEIEEFEIENTFGNLCLSDKNAGLLPWDEDGNIN